MEGHTERVGPPLPSSSDFKLGLFGNPHDSAP